MATKHLAVFGIYPDQLSTEDAVDALRENGFKNTDISVLFPDNQGTKDFAHEKHTKAPEGAVTGGASGAIVGGALGWLVGMGALAIPGVGPVLAAGPLMAMLGGIGVGSAVGGLAGALVGAGIPEYEAKRYEGRVRKGGILLSLHCDDADWARRASKVLRETGAEDIATSAEAKADVIAPHDGQPEDHSLDRFAGRHDRPTTDSREYVVDQDRTTRTEDAVLHDVRTPRR